MSGWIKKSFPRLKDSSPKDLPIEWRMARGALKSKEIGVSRFTYEPNARYPYGHRHKEQEEVYLVVSGSGRARLDDEWVEVKEWDVVRVNPEVARAFEAGPDGLDLVCIGGRMVKGDNGDKVDGFWDGVDD